jgi:hypothetical protein
MPNTQTGIRVSWVRRMMMLAAISVSYSLLAACALPGPPRSWTPQSLAALPGETTCVDNLFLHSWTVVDESTLLMKTDRPDVYYLIKLDDNIQHLGSFDGVVVGGPGGWACGVNDARVYAWRGYAWRGELAGGIDERPGISYGPLAPHTTYRARRWVVAVRELTPELAARYVSSTTEWRPYYQL